MFLVAVVALEAYVYALFVYLQLHTRLHARRWPRTDALRLSTISGYSLRNVRQLITMTD